MYIVFLGKWRGREGGFIYLYICLLFIYLFFLFFYKIKDPAAHGVPYYPLLDKKNIELYEQYQQLARREERERNVVFVGRLANYKYFNMDQAIGNAIDLFEHRFCRSVTPLRWSYDAAVVTLTTRSGSQLQQLSSVSASLFGASSKSRVLWMVMEMADEPNITVHYHLEESSAVASYVYLPAGVTDVLPSAARVSVWQRAFQIAYEHLAHNDLHNTPTYCLPDTQLADVHSLHDLARFSCAHGALPLEPRPQLRVCAVSTRLTLANNDNGDDRARGGAWHEPPTQTRAGRFFALSSSMHSAASPNSLWTLYTTNNSTHNSSNNNNSPLDQYLLFSRQFHRFPTIVLNCDVAVWIEPSARITSPRFFEQILDWSDHGHHSLVLRSQRKARAAHALMFDLRMPMTATLLDTWYAQHDATASAKHDQQSALLALENTGKQLELAIERVDTNQNENFQIIDVET